MQSPSKRNATPPQVKLKAPNQNKLKRNKLKSGEERLEDKESVTDFTPPAMKESATPTPPPKKIPTLSLPKKKIGEEESPETSVQADSIPAVVASVPETSVGRSGRVRKAKVVFDPSDDQHSSKRKSAGADNESKAKKLPPKVVVEMKKEPPKKTSLPLVEVDLPNPSMISTRRKTIASFENGCIVCSRSDIRKGRFVNCIECNSRGHFTCLRNAKLISNSDEEANWQCAVCQTCSACCKSSNIEKLYKCNSCLNSYHLSCQKDKVAVINKKRFKCELCVSAEATQTNKHKQPVGPKHSKTPSLNGFAGFSQEETANVVNNENKPKLLKLEKKIEVLSKSSSIEQENSLAIDIGYVDTDIKDEALTPTSKLEEYLNGGVSSLSSSIESVDFTQSDLSSEPPNSYKEEMFEEPQIDSKADVQQEIKDEAVYDINSQIIPHESIPDVKSWDCDEVYTYFLGTTTPECAHLFKDNGIDGYALLLLKRDDVLKQFNLSLGAALRLHSHIVSLQYKNNNPILAWDDY